MRTPSTSSQAMVVVGCLFCVLFLGVADNQVLSPLLPAIRAQLGRTSHEVAFLFTGYSFAAGLSVLLWGPLSDAFGRKQGLLTGLVLFALGSLISFSASTFTILMAGRILTGMGGSMLSLNTLSYAADFFPYTSRGWAMGSIVSSYFAALILGVPIGSWVGDRLGWHAVFGMAAATAIILLIAINFSLPALRRGAQDSLTESSMAGQLRTYMGFLSTGRTIGALVGSFFASAGTTGFLAFLGVWLNDAFGISGRQVGLVFLASGSAALAASPFAGSLSDRIGKRVQFVLSNLSLAVFLFLLPGLYWGPPLFVVCGLISLSAAFRQGPMEALFTEVVGAPTRGSFIALKNSFSQLGIGLAALACGFLFEHEGYFAVCMLCALSNLTAAAVIALMVREKHL